MNVLSVDDHPLFSEGLRMMLLALSPDLNFNQAADCQSAMDLDLDDMDTILLDYHLPDVEDFDALSRMRDRFPLAKIVVISGEDSPQIIREVIKRGAVGYIPKSSKPDILHAALQLVLAGGTYLPPHVLEASTVKTVAEPTILEALSERQLSVLKGAIQGKLNKTIADELNIAEGTVKAHLSAAYRVLGAKNRTEAVFMATQMNLNLRD